MPLDKLKEYLDHNDVKYISIRHSPAYTAQEVAASGHIPGKELAKTVIVRSETLTGDEEIAFSAGSHSELLRLAYSDFERLVRPEVVAP